MRAIASRQNPIVADFRELAAHPDPAGERVLLDGAHLVRDAMAAGLRFEAAVVATSRLTGRTEEAHLAEALGVAGRRRGIGRRACVRRREPHAAALGHRRHRPALSRYARRSRARRDTALILVAAEVQDPGNVGALIRAAEAGGADGVVVTTGSANPFSWKALRGSMGSALRLPVVIGLDLDAAMAALDARGVEAVAAVPRSGVDPDALDWSGRVAVWIGAEGQGLPDADRAALPAPRHDSDGRRRRVAERGRGRRRAGLRGPAPALMSDAGLFDDEPDGRRPAVRGRRRRHGHGTTRRPGRHAAGRAHASAHARRDRRPGRHPRARRAAAARDRARRPAVARSSGVRRAPARRRSRASSPS